MVPSAICAYILNVQDARQMRDKKETLTKEVYKKVRDLHCHNFDIRILRVYIKADYHKPIFLSPTSRNWHSTGKELVKLVKLLLLIFNARKDENPWRIS